MAGEVSSHITDRMKALKCTTLGGISQREVYGNLPNCRCITKTGLKNGRLPRGIQDTYMRPRIGVSACAWVVCVRTHMRVVKMAAIARTVRTEKRSSSATKQF